MEVNEYILIVYKNKEWQSYKINGNFLKIYTNYQEVEKISEQLYKKGIINRIININK